MVKEKEESEGREGGGRAISGRDRQKGRWAADTWRCLDGRGKRGGAISPSLPVLLRLVTSKISYGENERDLFIRLLLIL